MARAAENARQAVRRSIIATYGLEAMVRRTEDILEELVSGQPASEIALRFG